MSNNSRCIRTVVPNMRKQKMEKIIHVGSVVRKRNWAFHGGYTASKFALTRLTQSLQEKFANSGIAATLILPASIRPNFFSSATSTSNGYEPKILGPVQNAEIIAQYILKSAKRPKENVYTI